jgi:peroxiredoxin
MRLNAFSADPQYCAGKIAVASDPDGAIATSYGLTKMDIKPGMKDSRGVEIDHDFTERTTFVVMPDGKIAATFSTSDDKISPADHVQKSLAAVQQMATSKSSKQ